MSGRAQKASPGSEGYWGSREQACAALGISDATLVRLRRSGKIKSRRHPDDLRFSQYWIEGKVTDVAAAVGGDTIAIQHIIDLRVEAEHAKAQLEAAREWRTEMRDLVRWMIERGVQPPVSATGTNG